MRASECSWSDFHENNRDMRFEKLDLPIKQEDLEAESGITDIFADRYEKGPSSARIIRQIRKHNVFYPYIRKTINWSLSCETGDDAFMPRKDAYDNILTRLLESQVITIGKMSETPTTLALVIFIAALIIAVTVLIIKCCVTEEDSTWLSRAKMFYYYSYIVTFFTTSVLLGFVTVEFSMALKVTSDDHTFVVEDLASIQTCLDDYA